MWTFICGKPKVQLSTRRTMGDITIILPLVRKHRYLETSQYIRNKGRIQIACPRQASGAELKRRITGKTNIPADFIRLTYGGEVIRKYFSR